MWIGASDKESLKALRYALELGVNFIDTALVYGDGHSEKLIGRAIEDAPHKVYVATSPAEEPLVASPAWDRNRRGFRAITLSGRPRRA